MDNTVFIVIVSLTATVLAIKPELTITPPGPIKEGDTVTINCSIQGIAPLDLIRLVRQIEGKPHEIITNNHLKEHMSNTGRYKLEKFVTVMADPEAGILGSASVEITISKIKGADAGNIGCKHLPGNEGAYEDLIVKVPPKSVELLFVDREGELSKAVEGQTVQMQKGTAGGIICKVVVEGSDFKPDIKVLLGDQDITSTFKQNETMLKEANHGLLRYHYAADLEWRPDAPKLEYNGKTLKCEAKMPQFEATTVSVVLEVFYPPEVVCNEEMYAKTAEKFRVYCVGTMHPAPNPESVIWSWGAKPDRVILYAGAEEGHIAAKLEAKEDSQFHLILDIDGVKPEDFTNYKIKVSNGIGEAENSVKLVEALVVTYKPTPNPTPSPGDKGDSTQNKIVGSSAASFSGALLLLLVAMLIAAIFKS